MSNEDKILIDKKCIEKIKISLNTIRLMTKEKNVKRETEKLLELLNDEVKISSLSIEERILKKMKETKGSDPDMNANLYILHRKLVNGQISERQALELFDMYVKIEPYDSKIY